MLAKVACYLVYEYEIPNLNLGNLKFWIGTFSLNSIMNTEWNYISSSLELFCFV